MKVLAASCLWLLCGLLYLLERTFPIPEFNDSSPIATPAQFKTALLTVRQQMTEKQLAMLRAHCRAPNHTITATGIAEALSFSSVGVANLQYGKFAQRIADALQFTPSQRPDGKIRWWSALAYGLVGSDEARNGNYEWVMRPELVAALQSMKWA
jgi:predicted benzoate:H+ symporter BenE